MNSAAISYQEFERSDFQSFLKMGQKLWPDFDKNELEKLLKQSTESNKTKIIIAKNPKGICIGFAIFSIRVDYVEGAVQSPTGYLEGIFVEEAFRKKGIAKHFVRLGEKWCKEKGCIQLGSDTWLDDEKSRKFHKKVGFWEEEEVVHFLKDL